MPDLPQLPPWPATLPRSVPGPGFMAMGVAPPAGRLALRGGRPLAQQPA